MTWSYVLLVLGAVVACESPSFNVARGGQLRGTLDGSVLSFQPPGDIEFERALVQPGQSLKRVVELRNVSDAGTLTLSSLELDVGSLSTHVFSFAPPAEPIVLAPGESVQLTLYYRRPESERDEDGPPAQAWLRVVSDTTEEAEQDLHFRVKENDGHPVMNVPTSLDFGVVRPGESRSLDLTATNTGSAGLRMLEARIDGSTVFVSSISAGDQAPVTPRDETAALPLTFTPGSTEATTATLFLRTNEAEGSNEHSVALLGNVNVPELMSKELIFGLIVGSDEKPLKLSSVGKVDLEITDVRLAPGSDPAFELVPDAWPSPEVPWVLHPNENSGDRLQVRFTSGVAKVDQPEAIVQLTANTLDIHHTVAVSAKRLEDACPEARITSVDGKDPPTALEPGHELVVSGVTSLAVGPTNIAGYEWKLDVVPSGFVQPVDLITNAQVLRFSPSVEGKYRISLTVFDSKGRASCVPRTLELDVHTLDVIWFEAAWTAQDRQGDLVPVNLDLHLARALQAEAPNWFCAPDDCFPNTCHYDEKSLVWGTSSLDDDPNFWAVSFDGLTPEVVRVRAPFPGRYELAVSRPAPTDPAAAQPSVSATVKVSSLGTELHFSNVLLPPASVVGSLWHVATLIVANDNSIELTAHDFLFEDRGLPCVSQ